VALLLAGASCSRDQKPGVKKIAAGAQYSGFLKDYTKLKPIAGMDDKATGYADSDAKKNLHKYIAMVIDPVEIYLASDADDAKMSDAARSAATEYFRAALVKAVSQAYPVVDEPGPLVLRLQAAIVGVDFGGAVAAADNSDKEKGLSYMVNIGKVRVEMELLDSETGEQIAAFVDQENLGNGAEIGSVNSREEKWAAAREAFDGWAARVRNFLNVENEIPAEEADRVDQSYQPYSVAPVSGK
jgi:hypothetical protein